MTISPRISELKDEIAGHMGAVLALRARVRRLSRADPPPFLRNLCEEFKTSARDNKHDVMWDVIDGFVDMVEKWRERARLSGPRSTWNDYEDQKLRKPLKRIRRAKVELHRAITMRRLQPSGPISFLTPTRGMPLKLLGTPSWASYHAPIVGLLDKMNADVQAEPGSIFSLSAPTAAPVAPQARGADEREGRDAEAESQSGSPPAAVDLAHAVVAAAAGEG